MKKLLVDARNCKVCRSFYLFPGHTFYSDQSCCSPKCYLESRKETRAPKERFTKSYANEIFNKKKRKNKHRKKRIKDNFYRSEKWLALRYQALKKYGRVCALCRTESGEMHVDHIKPRSKYRNLEYDFSNLQILCKQCNLGKSNQDDEDFRAYD